MTSFEQITKESPFPIVGYSVTAMLSDLEDMLARYQERYALQLDPEFQRAHVWTEEQQSRFVEYFLQKGPSGRDIYFACKGWQRNFEGPMYLVDGKQRLKAVRKFMRNELRVFGSYRKEISGVLRMIHHFTFHIGDLNYPDTLKWYIALNSGGTQHTPEEIARVKALLEKTLV